LKRQAAKGAKMVEPSPEHDRLAHEVVDAAFSVHSTLGPGLLESAYEQCMAYGFESRAIQFRRQVILPIVYRGYEIEAGYRMDMVVGGRIIVEIKAVEKLLTIHEAQLDTYLKLPGFHLGLLINFNVPLIKYGIRRRIWSH
jgi:GxxExxY protein